MCLFQISCGETEEFPEAYRPIQSPPPNDTRNRQQEVSLPPYSKLSWTGSSRSPRASRDVATQTHLGSIPSDAVLPPYPGSDTGIVEETAEIAPEVHALTTTSIEHDLELVGWVFDPSEFEVHDFGMRYYDMAIDANKIFSIRRDPGKPKAMLVGTKRNGWFMIRRNEHYDIEKGWMAPLEAVVFMGTSDREMLRRVRDLAGQVISDGTGEAF